MKKILLLIGIVIASCGLVKNKPDYRAKLDSVVEQGHKHMDTSWSVVSAKTDLLGEIYTSNPDEVNRKWDSLSDLFERHQSAFDSLQKLRGLYIDSLYN